MRVGVVGLGAMGRGMAANLARSTHETWVWNRTAAVATAFGAEHSVHVAETPAELASAVEVVLTCVSREQDVHSVIDAMLPKLGVGQIVIDTSTIHAHAAQAMAQQLQSVGAEFLDGPVSGGMEGARNATLAMMIGGDAAALERARPVLEVITARIAHMGPVGNGQKTKAVNQVMAAGINQAVCEALAFGQAMQLPMEQVLEVVSNGAAGNWFVQHRGPTMIQDVFEPGFKLALHHKDLGICHALADDCGGSLPLSDRTMQDYQTLMDAGQGELDISALFQLKQALFKRPD